MKLLVLLLLVHQAMSCCLPSQHQFTMMSETRINGSARIYTQITLAGDHGKGIQVMKIQSHGVTVVKYLDIANKTLYSSVPQWNYCQRQELNGSQFNEIAKARCVPDGGQINYNQHIILAGGVPSRIISGNFNVSQSGYPIRFDAVVTGPCTPIIARVALPGVETLSIFGNYTDMPSDELLALPQACANATKRSALRFPADALKRSVHGPFGHVLHL